MLTIPADKTVTLDLNGLSITSAGKVIKNNGILTITDTKGGGKIISTGNTAVGVGDNSKTTIKTAIIESVEGAVITGYATGATINIEDGIFSASDNAVVAGNGNRTNEAGARGLLAIRSTFLVVRSTGRSRPRLMLHAVFMLRGKIRSM